MAGLLNFGLGLGLASIAGLRAYFPLVMIGLISRYDQGFSLQPPFALLTSLPVLFSLVFLMFLEFITDKLPAAAAFNQLVQTPARIIAGAIIFAAAMKGANGFFALVAGGIITGGIALARPYLRIGVTEVTGEDNEYFLSSVEDLLAITGTLVILLVPFLSLVGLTAAIILGYRNFRDRYGARVSWRG